MAQENIKKTAEQILEYVGGIDNVTGTAHCMTRLRLTLKDESLVNKEALEQVDLVKGQMSSGGQFQIILGTGIVNKVYKEFTKITGEMEVTDDNRSTFQKVISFFGDVFIPIIPAIIASGILMGIKSFLVSAGVVDTSNGWYEIITVLSDTAFTFLPALVLWSTMKKMGGTPVLGIIIGLMLVNPILPSGGAVAKGNVDALAVPIFGFQYLVTSFSGRVLPSMAVGIFAAYVEKYSRKYSPAVLDAVITPLLVCALSLLAGLFVLGPITGFFEDMFVNIYSALIFLPLGIGGFIIAFTQQFLVITGMHHALWIIDINLMDTFGENAMAPIRSASVMGQTGAVFALALFMKDAKARANNMGSFISGIFGITEPAIFGGTLLYPGVFVCGALGAGVGGMLSRLINLTGVGFGTNGLPAYFFYTSSMQDMLEFTLVLFVTFIVSFVTASIFVKKKGI